MKYTFLFLSLTFPSLFFSQNTDYCAQQKKLLGVIKKYHYNPPVFDAKTNTEVLDLFIEKLDPQRIYFYKKDIDNFKQIISDTSGEEAYCTLFQTAWPVYKKRLQQADSLITVIGDKPLDYSSKDTVYFHSKTKREYAATILEAKKKFEKRIKIGVMMRVLKPKEENEEVAAITKEKFKQIEPAERKIVVTKEKREYTLILSDENRIKEHVFIELNDAICKRCDPHSDYFTLKDKESFEGSLSTEQMSFGFSVADNSDGEISIAHLVPGSPAWKSNSLHEEDVVISIKWPEKEPIDMSAMDSEEFYEELGKSSSSKIQLTIRQKNNTVKNVNLEKAKIESEENTLNSFVLLDGNTKLGYIPLPSFYMDFDDESRPGCANDVAKEIIKLKAENIQGLILDLRYNGGGSMKEAMDLAGIFIDEGPLAILRSKKEKPFTLKDLNRGTMYDGPLLVLINNYSASASEFFSAAVQDYNRALIVGSSSYGKATAQNIIPADTNLMFYKNKKNITSGYVKLTLNKFYRVTGVSHQSSGIKPDIYLPDLLDKISSTENKMPFALSADTVNKKVVFKPYAPLPKEELRKKSTERVNASTRFAVVKQLEGDVEKVWQTEYKMPLTLEDCKKYLVRMNGLQSKIQNMSNDTLQSGLKVENNNYSKDLMDFSEYRKDQNKRLISTISEDIYIKECFLILKDLNIFNKN